MASAYACSSATAPHESCPMWCFEALQYYPLLSHWKWQVIDDQGVNRTPKPLTAILPSAALRQARGIAPEEGGTLGSEASFDGLAERGGCLSSSGFSRGWFSEIPSGGLTPAAETSAVDFDKGKVHGCNMHMWLSLHIGHNLQQPATLSARQACQIRA